MTIRRVVLLLLALGAMPAAGPPSAAPVMTIGRLHYDGGGDWYANPSSLPNLLTAIRTRTGLRVTAAEKVVTLSDDELWNVPYIYMTGHGNVHWSDQDVITLRRYLQQGGFLHADDNYGMDQSIRRELESKTSTRSMPTSAATSSTSFTAHAVGMLRKGSGWVTNASAESLRSSTLFSAAVPANAFPRSSG